MGLVKVAKRKDITFDYKDGYAEVEVLQGECDQAKFVRCSLMPGCSIKPELVTTKEHTQVFLFLEGKGYVVTPRKGFNIESCCYVCNNFVDLTHTTNTERSKHSKDTEKNC